jgi:biopolymer transport protein ExbD
MENSQFDYINVIPLVDIMLVLLTIVLTTSTLVASGAIPLELPHASKQQDDFKHLQTIVIDKKGLIYFNGSQISLYGLQQSFVAVERTTPVLIRADKELVLQVFVDVLDVIKQLKFSNVSLQTDVSK